MPTVPGIDLAIDIVRQVQKDTFAMVGDLRLDLGSSPKGWEEKLGHEWAEHSTLGDRPKLQSIGNKLDEIKLDFQLHESKADIGNVWDTLQGYKEAAKILPITMGDGEFLGTFVILEMTIIRQSTFATGTIMAATIQITFKEWVDTPALQVIARPPRAVKTDPKVKSTFTRDSNGNIVPRGTLPPMMKAH